MWRIIPPPSAGRGSHWNDLETVKFTRRQLTRGGATGGALLPAPRSSWSCGNWLDSIYPQRRCASRSRVANQSRKGPLRKISNPPISAVQISLKALSEGLQLLWRIDARGDPIPELIAHYSLVSAPHVANNTATLGRQGKSLERFRDGEVYSTATNPGRGDGRRAPACPTIELELWELVGQY